GAVMGRRVGGKARGMAGGARAERSCRTSQPDCGGNPGAGSEPVDPRANAVGNYQFAGGEFVADVWRVERFAARERWQSERARAKTGRCGLHRLLEIVCGTAAENGIPAIGRG